MRSGKMILVIDFGSQYNQLLTRQIRELGEYSELHSRKLTAEQIKEMAPKGIILSGRPQHIHDENSYSCDKAIFDLGIPILGIWYGMQVRNQQFGGKVEKIGRRTYEAAEIHIHEHEQPLLFKDVPETQSAWLSRGDRMINIPESFTADAEDSEGNVVAMSHPEKKMYGILFHPEVKGSTYGTDLLKQFLFSVCDCRGDIGRASCRERE